MANAIQYALTQLTWPTGGIVGTASATITAPDGTVQTVAATTASAQNPGSFTAWFTPTQVGSHTVVWTSTGGQTSSSTLTVATPSAAVSVMTIQDCYASLKLDASLIGTNPGRDADMLAYAAAAQGVVEGIVGPISPTTISEVFDGDRAAVLLRAKPTSIQSVTLGGQPVLSWVPDFAAGIIYLLTPNVGVPAIAIRSLRVVYTAGTGQAPPNVALGIREVFRQVWERSRAMGGQASSDIVMQGFAIPNAVYELLAASGGMPGFA